MSTNKIQHTPGDWEVIEEDGEWTFWLGDIPGTNPIGVERQICWEPGVYEGEPQWDIADGNAELITLAPTAPHDCDVPGCPGPKNKAKLEAAEELAVALSISQQIQLHLSNGCDECEDGIFCPTADQWYIELVAKQGPALARWNEANS